MSCCEHLKRAVEAIGNNEVARKLGCSRATISRIVNGSYPNPEKICKKAESIDLENEPGICPVLGEIHPDVCARYSAWAHEGKVHRDRMYRQVKDACISCSKKEKK